MGGGVPSATPLDPPLTRSMTFQRTQLCLNNTTQYLNIFIIRNITTYLQTLKQCASPVVGVTDVTVGVASELHSNARGP